jgi:ribosomal protein L7Ae-like RNA K-turn-binding protein
VLGFPSAKKPKRLCIGAFKEMEKEPKPAVGPRKGSAAPVDGMKTRMIRRQVDRNKRYSKSHSVTQDIAVPLSYAQVAKQKAFGKRASLLHTETSTNIYRETKKGILVSRSVGYPNNSEKPRLRKFRLVPNPNPLDSRAPQLIRRGKERAKGPKKKQSKLKRTILEARSRGNPLDSVPKPQKGESSSHISCEASANKDKTQPALPSHKKVKYREYCDMYITKNVNMLTEKLLSELMRFQERVRNTQPAKAKAKRRLVIGLKETIQCLKVNKIKCVIIPPDIEPCPLEGGLDDRLELVRKLCTDKQVPIVYALGVHKIPKALGLPNRRHKTSAVGIYSYEGAFELFKQVVEEARKERERWRENHETKQNAAEDESCPMKGSDASNQPPIVTSQLSADAKPFIPQVFKDQSKEAEE